MRPVPDDDLPQTSQGRVVPDDDLPGARPTPSRRRGAFEVANDLVIEAGNAVAGAVKSGSDFVSPGNRVGKFIDENIIKPGEAAQSDVARASKERFRQDVDQAGSIGGEIAAVGRYALDSPGLVAAQALGSFAIPAGAVTGAGLIGSRLGLSAAKAGLAGGAVAGGALAGGDAAGTAYELVMAADEAQLRALPEWAELARQGLSPTQIREDLATRAARAGSAVPAVVGAAGGMVGAERLLAGAGKATGRLATAGRAALTEGLQETAEEGITQYSGQKAAQQYDETIDAGKGVAAAAAMGGLMGSGTGGVVGAITGAKPEETPAAAPQDDSPAVLESQLTKLENAVEALRGPDPKVVADAVLSAGSVDEAIAVAEALTDRAGPATPEFEVRRQEAEDRRVARQQAAQGLIAEQLGLQPLAAPAAEVEPVIEQPAGTPDLQPGQARVLGQTAPVEQLQARVAQEAEAAGEFTPAQKQEVARRRIQAPQRLAVSPVEEAAQRAQTSPATSPADVKRIAEESEREVLERWQKDYETQDAAERQAAAQQAADEALRSATAARAASFESAEADLTRLAQAERQRAVDQLVTAVAEPAQYSTAATVIQVNRRLLGLKMEPLSGTERGRVARMVDAARTFTSVKSTPEGVPVQADTNADNSSMESLVPLKTSDPRVANPQQTEQTSEVPQQPYTHDQSRIVSPAELGPPTIEYRLARAVSKLFGRQLVVFDSDRDDAPDGYVRPSDTKTIYLNRKSGINPLVVAGHETLHQVRREQPAAYEAIMRAIKLRAGADLNAPGLNNDMEEVTADVVGNLMTTPAFWLDVMGQMTVPQAKSLGDLISDVVDRFATALGGLRGYDTTSMVANLGEVRKAASQALAQFLDQDLSTNRQNLDTSEKRVHFSDKTARPSAPRSTERPTLNIGMSTREVAGGGELNEASVRKAIGDLGVSIDAFVVHTSDSEPTAVVTIDRPLTAAEGDSLSVQLQQEAIVQRMPDGTGDLFGPQKDNWGPYNPEFFMMPDGSRAAKAEEPVTGSARREQSMARKDSEAIIALRKQQSVLRSILTCLGS